MATNKMKVHVYFVILAIIAAEAAAGDFKPGLRAKFATGQGIGESYFFKVPTTVDEAVQEGWKQTKRPKGPLPQLVMYCYSDKVMCALYDDTENVAGVQVAIAKAESSENVFDWVTRGFTSWNTAVEGQCKKFWTLQQYFVDEEYLSQSKAERVAARERDPDRLLQAGAVWLTGTNKQLERISINETDIIEENLFTEQACVPAMGTHYYYNMTTSTECVADQMYPWFLLEKNGELVGTGFVTIGQLEIRDGQRDWFERAAVSTVLSTIPNGPTCLYEYSDSPGTVTMHIYYIDDPWNVTC